MGVLSCDKIGCVLYVCLLFVVQDSFDSIFDVTKYEELLQKGQCFFCFTFHSILHSFAELFAYEYIEEYFIGIILVVYGYMPSTYAGYTKAGKVNVVMPCLLKLVSLMV